MTVQTRSKRDLPARDMADTLAGDPGQRLVAHMVLALISCHLRMEAMVDLHISGALDLLDEQPDRLKTLRALHDMRLVRILTQSGEMSATLLLAMIGETVIAPIIDFKTILPILRTHSGCSATIGVHDIEIDHVRVRLRTAWLKTALQDIMDIGFLETRADRITGVLNQCVRPSLKPAAPLDMAEAFFALARTFARQDNHAFAKLSLQKADLYIRLYADGADNEAHRALSESLTEKIGGLVDRLGASAS